jgi:DNA-binding SARP family transcriptional activator/tetratricopeptide (TPR) repeat protein
MRASPAVAADRVIADSVTAETASRVRFGLLGSLQVIDADGEIREVAGAKLRVALAALLLGNGGVVSAAGLVEALWDESPPANAAAALRLYITRLRRALGPAGSRIVGQPSGWAVQLHGPGDFDLSEVDWLRQTAQAAAETGQWRQVSSLLATALSLWRGEPLLDVPSSALARREVERLSELRLRLTEARVDADLRLGRHRDLVPELRLLVAQHPLRELLQAQLMLACYRSGQQAAALAVYRDARTTLAEELGVEPGPELRDLHQKVLAADPDLQRPAALTVVADQPVSGQPQQAGSVAGVPRQLPAAVRNFTGRAAQLARLTELADQARADATEARVVISGMAGVGKTTLAVYWARQAARLFPDGQLHVDLEGFTPSREPVSPDAVIRGFLEALGVPAGQVPASPQAQAGLYRSILADKNVLVLLDNARDAAQVRPLLPGAPGSMVLVTSRDQLTGLAATEDTSLLSLDVLADDDARDLLAARLGADRAATQAAAMTEIARLCGHLPLALAITAARAAARPGHPLSALASELRAADGLLDALDGADAASSVRAVFSWSYHQLTPAAARAFRLLGLHPGPHITGPALASLAGLPQPQARTVIRDLTRTWLLTEPAAGRYALHDLLRAYAAEQASAHETEDDRHAALQRMFDHYVASAESARAASASGTRKTPVDPLLLAPGVEPEEHTGRDAAIEWLTSEYAILLRLIRLAAETGFDTHAWRLPWALANYFDWRGLDQDGYRTHQIAAAAAARLGDRWATALSLVNWAGSDMYSNRLFPAEQRLRRALDLFAQIGDRVGQAVVLLNLGAIADEARRYQEAIELWQQACQFAAEAGDNEAQCAALGRIGLCYVRAGQHHAAVEPLTRAQQMSSETGDRTFRAGSAHALGRAFYALGDHRKAIASHQAAVEICGEYGDQAYLPEILSDLADAYNADGRRADAVRACEQALAILTDLGHPDAAKARSKLEKLKARPAAPVPPPE